MAIAGTAAIKTIETYIKTSRIILIFRLTSVLEHEHWHG